MPELPEVETYRRYFERHALEQELAAVDVHDPRILENVTPPILQRRFVGTRFVSVRRHGKHLFAATSSDRWLHLHFGMSGDLIYSAAGEPSRFARVSFRFRNGARLSFDDMRLFGWVAVVDSAEDEIVRRELGPDPLELSARAFAAIVNGRRGAIKALLMNQSNIAGLGNLYVDEMLFQSSIDPRRAADTLTEREISTMYRAMKKILETMIELHANDRPAPRRWLIDRRDVDNPCPRCGGRITRATLFGRTTYFCADHQT